MKARIKIEQQEAILHNSKSKLSATEATEGEAHNSN